MFSKNVLRKFFRTLFVTCFS